MGYPPPLLRSSRNKADTVLASPTFNRTWEKASRPAGENSGLPAFSPTGLLSPGLASFVQNIFFMSLHLRQPGFADGHIFRLAVAESLFEGFLLPAGETLPESQGQ